MLNRWVLSRDRKTATEGAEVTRSGRLFKMRAAATGKARSTTVDSRVRLTISDERKMNWNEPWHLFKCLRIMCAKYYELRYVLKKLHLIKVGSFAWYSLKIHVIFHVVSSLKDEKLIKKQTYTKAATCKLYSRVFWTFKPNFIKIDSYNFKLYRFKIGLGACVCAYLKEYSKKWFTIRQHWFRERPGNRSWWSLVHMRYTT